MKQRIIYLFPLLFISLLVSCEDSFLMKKLKGGGDSKTPPPVTQKQTEDKTPEQPAATAKTETSQAPQDNIINRMLQKDTEPAPTRVTAPTVPETKAPEPGNSALKEELKRYVACLNRTRERVSSSRERYLSWITSESTGPNCTERYISYGLYTLYADGMKTCREAADLGAQTEPSLPELEAAAGRLAGAYEQLVPLTQEASDYYEQEDYKDDQCAKAKALHPKLMGTFTEYLAAAALMDQQLAPLQEKIVNDDLARLEAEGKQMPWYVTKYLQSAQAMEKQIPANAKAPWNAAGYQATFRQLDTDYQALENYAQAHSDETQKILLFSMFQSSAKDFYVNAKLLGREVAAGSKIDGRKINEFIRDYNEMINRANSLRY